MEDGFVVFYLILKKIIDFVFNDFVIYNGVTLGWFIIAVIMTKILITSVISIPKSMSGSINIKNTYKGEEN